jgi:hypothetical protein
MDFTDDNTLRDHFATYCKSLYKDVLTGYKEYAQATTPTDTTSYKTFYDYLEILKEDIFRNIEDSSFDGYLNGIYKFSHSILNLMKKMVGDELRSGKTVIDLLDEDSGWAKFRYSSVKTADITFKEIFDARRIHVIPYYGDYNRDVWETLDLVFDVDEISLLEGLDWDKQKEFLSRKLGVIKHKIMGVDMAPTPLREVNLFHSIGDWKLLGTNL